MSEEGGRVWSEHQWTKNAIAQYLEEFNMAFVTAEQNVRLRKSVLNKKFASRVEGPLRKLELVMNVSKAFGDLSYISEYFDGNMIVNENPESFIEKRDDGEGGSSVSGLSFRSFDEGERFLALKRVRRVLVSQVRDSDILNVLASVDDRPAVAKQADDNY